MLGDLLDSDGVELTFLEEVVGNGSPVETPLMEAIKNWVGAEDDPAAA